MSVEHLPINVPAYVYALMCEDDFGNGYMKIGRTCDIARRYRTLLSGCPFPIKRIALFDCGIDRKSQEVEKLLHSQLEAKRSRGEWFLLNFKNDQDKELFQAASKLAFRKHFPRRKDAWWFLINPSDPEDSSVYLNIPNTYRERRRAEWRESYIRSKAKSATSEEGFANLLERTGRPNPTADRLARASREKVNELHEALINPSEEAE